MATRCTTAQQFIETFHRFCDEQSFFVATTNMRAVGLETPFSIQLADKTPVLQGLCVVLAAYAGDKNPYKRPGVRLGIRRLTPESEAVFYQLQALRTAAPVDIVSEASEGHALPAIPPPPSIAPKVRLTPPPIPAPHASELVVPKPDGQRTPGSDLVLPANPLMNLSDESLVGFVDCTLYEETANFFRAPEDNAHVDEPAPPPKPAVMEALPQFRPSQVIESAFPLEEAPAPAPTPSPTIPPPISVTESSVVAQLARVEHSVARLVETLDTSRPIDVRTGAQAPLRAAEAAVDEAARATPMPAGEAYARQVAKRASRSRTKYYAIGGGAVALLATVVVIVATRGDDEPAPAQQAAKVVEPAPPKPPPEAPKPADEKPPEVDVDGDELAAVTDPKTPAVGEGPCKLDVTTTPAGTMVKLDGQTIGPSPVSIAGPCARRRVDLVHPRYKAEQRFVTLAADKPNALDVTLVRPTHTLTILTNPTGATISIGGRRAGTSPTKLPLMGFSGIEVKIDKAGYETVSKRIYSKKPEDSLNVTLKRARWK